MPEAVIDAIRDVLKALQVVDKVEIEELFDPVSSQKYRIKAYKVGAVTRVDIQHA
jgi:hypothetical protein